MRTRVPNTVVLPRLRCKFEWCENVASCCARSCPVRWGNTLNPQATRDRAKLRLSSTHVGSQGLPIQQSVRPSLRALPHPSEHQPTPQSTSPPLREPAHPTEHQPTPESTSPRLRAPAHAAGGQRSLPRGAHRGARLDLARILG